MVVISKEELDVLKKHYKKVYTHSLEEKTAISFQYLEKMLPIMTYELLLEIKELLSDRDNKTN